MKIKLSKSQWEEAGEKAGWIKAAVNTNDEKSLRAMALKWWNSLSINEEKELTRKYYPNPHITWTFICSTPSFIEDIYKKEINKDNSGISMKTAGGHGRFSEELTDIIEGQALSRITESPETVAAMIKADSILVEMMKEEEMTDQELLDIINETRWIYNRYKSS